MISKDYYKQKYTNQFTQRIMKGKKTYILLQEVFGEESAPCCTCYGSKEDAFRQFDGQMPGWKTRNDFYITENNNRIPKT